LSYIAKSSVVVFEDVIGLSNRESRTLRFNLNIAVHHDDLTSIVLSHSLVKTSLISTLPFFDTILITNSLSNSSILKLLLQFFKIDKDVIVSHLALSH
jgi:hypothetical protein